VARNERSSPFTTPFSTGDFLPPFRSLLVTGTSGSAEGRFLLWPGHACDCPCTRNENKALGESFVWISKRKIGVLRGAVYSASATLPIANNSLTAAHYKVNALGFLADAMLPDRKVAIGVKHFREFQV
jgi:hypothetical protein